MSLTTFVEHPNVRSVFNKYCPIPKALKPKVRPIIKATSLSKNYSQVGIAFDYLFRIYLQRLNSTNAKEFGWVAYNSIRLINKDSDKYTLAHKIIEDAESQRDEYIRSGLITDSLLYSVLGLASLDPIFRANRGFEYIGRAEPDDVTDLKQLIQLINPQDWKSERRCWLNPKFNASLLVGGADADIIIDDALIEVKTVKRLCIGRNHINQLLGYYLLDRIAGIDEQASSSIKRLGIYFSRYGYLWSIEVEDLISQEMTEKIIFWWYLLRAKEWEMLQIPEPKDPRTRKTAISPTPPPQPEQAVSSSP